MNNINDILHKSYQRIGSASGDTFYAQQLDGEFVIFSNGARIKLTTLLADFQAVNSNGSVNENVQTVNTGEVNPDTFFNSTTPLPEVKTVDHIAPVTAQSLIDGKPALSSTQPTQLGGLNLVDEPQTQQPGLNLTAPSPVSNRLPEWDSFDRVKKTEDVELNVTIQIKLPKARHIEFANDMYETSFIAYLAKQYMAEPGNIQKQIREAIEDWVDMEMNGGKPKKKKISKTIKPTKKGKGMNLAPTPKPVKNEDVPIVPLTETGSAASMFGQEIVKDVTKLAIIAEEEQYIAAKQYFSKLEDTHKDYYRFESMINLWEENQIK